MGKHTDWGSRTVSRTCSIALQAMKSVKVTVALPPPLGVMVKGFVFTCAQSQVMPIKWTTLKLPTYCT